MNSYDFVGMLAQTETQGNPVLGWLIIGGVAWMLITLFSSKKKDRYAVSRTTSVRKLPSK